MAARDSRGTSRMFHSAASGSVIQRGMTYRRPSESATIRIGSPRCDRWPSFTARFPQSGWKRWNTVTVSPAMWGLCDSRDDRAVCASGAGFHRERSGADHREHRREPVVRPCGRRKHQTSAMSPRWLRNRFRSPAAAYSLRPQRICVAQPISYSIPPCQSEVQHQRRW